METLAEYIKSGRQNYPDLSKKQCGPEKVICLACGKLTIPDHGWAFCNNSCYEFYRVSVNLFLYGSVK